MEGRNCLKDSDFSSEDKNKHTKKVGKIYFIFVLGILPKIMGQYIFG